MIGLLEILRPEILVQKTLIIVAMQDCIWAGLSQAGGSRQSKKLRYHILCALKSPKNRRKNNFNDFKKILKVFYTDYQIQSCGMEFLMLLGGFDLVGVIITELKDCMTCYKFERSHWWKM